MKSEKFNPWVIVKLKESYRQATGGPSAQERRADGNAEDRDFLGAFSEETRNKLQAKVAFVNAKALVDEVLRAMLLTIADWFAGFDENMEQWQAFVRTCPEARRAIWNTRSLHFSLVVSSLFVVGCCGGSRCATLRKRRSRTTWSKKEILDVCAHSRT